MNQILYLAWRYLAFHRLKTFILLTSITLILYLPVGLRVIVNLHPLRGSTGHSDVRPLETVHHEEQRERARDGVCRAVTR